MFADLPEWIRQVLRSLSRSGYIYIGRSGVGLSHAFRKGLSCILSDRVFPFSPGDEGPLTECMKQGTIRAIEELAKFQDLAYRLLLEEIAIQGPKWVAYEKIQELCEQYPIESMKEELT